MTSKQFGLFLKEQRVLKKMTQTDIGNKMGVKKNFISKIENGRTDLQVSTIERYINALGVKVELRIV